MPGCNRHDEPRAVDVAANMGSPTGETSRSKNCDGRPRASHCCHLASDLGRWHRVPTGCSTKYGLIECLSTRCLLDRRPSRSRRDVVPMMPRSGPSLTSIKHANEMGTSELHRTSIMLAAVALTTNRSMYPKDLNQRPRQKAGRTRTDTATPPWRINHAAQKRLTGKAPLPKPNWRNVEVEKLRWSPSRVALLSSCIGFGSMAPCSNRM